MKIYNSTLKVYRFDFNIDILKNKPQLDIRFEIQYQLYPAPDGEKDAFKYGLRIAMHITEISSKKEAIGYLSEYFTDFVIENSLVDYPAINRYVGNAFLNHENYFQLNKPKEVFLDNLIVNPNINNIADNIFTQLKKEGYY